MRSKAAAIHALGGQSARPNSNQVAAYPQMNQAIGQAQIGEHVAAAFFVVDCATLLGHLISAFLCEGVRHPPTAARSR
jgi:hypothetical protein